MRIRTFFLCLVVATLSVATASPALGAFDGHAHDRSLTLAFTEAEDDAGEEEAEEMISEGGVVPAVEAPPIDEEEADQPWTFRYMGPTVLAIGVLGLIGAGIYYAFRVRGRYQVVE